MLVKQAPVQQVPKKPLTASIACNILEVREAQRLRYRIFAEEMGARVPGREQGIDCDIYDAYCDHLLVRDAETREVVGTYRILIGCASISMADGGHNAAGIYERLRQSHLSPVEYRVFPRCALPLDVPERAPAAPLPPLIKGYVRVGAYVCGAPAWDPDFNSADLLMLLPLSRTDVRYARHFLKAG